MHHSLGLAVAATLLAGCASAGLRVSPLRVIPPGPGECLGRVEVTVFNGTPEPIGLRLFHALQDGESGDDIGNGPLLGPGGPVFGTFDTYDFRSPPLASGDARILVKPMVIASPGPGTPIALQGEVTAFTEAGDRIEWTTAPVEVRPGGWPQPVTMTAEALDRALEAGHGLTIVLHEWAMPGGGVVSVSVGPDGRAQGWGSGRLSGKDERRSRFRSGGTLSPEVQVALHAAVRAAPFAAYRPHPENWKGMCDGHPVRLLVAAGPAAFAASSQIDDFQDAGLEPFLEHLRAVLRGLPEVDAAR